jgi:F0F1-type ATP synthase assembly protein I
MNATASKKSEDKQQPPEKSTAIILFYIAADTTWRMFVPTLGGTILGLWADSVWHTEPWWSIAGLTVGIIVTALLIKQQYNKANDNVK